MIRIFSHLQSAIGERWCQAMHSAPMWPVNGEYQCRQCFRRYRVPWALAAPAPEPEKHSSSELSSSAAQAA